MAHRPPQLDQLAVDEPGVDHPAIGLGRIDHGGRFDAGDDVVGYAAAPLIADAARDDAEAARVYRSAAAHLAGWRASH